MSLVAVVFASLIGIVWFMSDRQCKKWEKARSERRRKMSQEELRLEDALEESENFDAFMKDLPPSDDGMFSHEAYYERLEGDCELIVNEVHAVAKALQEKSSTCGGEALLGDC